MTPEHSEQPASVQRGIPFDSRLPSTSWELLSLTAPIPFSLWVWFKPKHAPTAVVIRIPDEVWQLPQPCQLSIRQLVQALEINPENVLTWYLYGIAYEGLNGTNQFFDLTIPPPATGIDPTITINLKSSCQQRESASGEQSTPTEDQAELDILQYITVEWNGSLQVEALFVLLRKQVVGTLSRLNSLNRGLTTDEQRFGDRKDITEWQDARRWLRDSISRLSRLLKDLDIGSTSPAGKRSRFEQLYHQFVVPRQSFEGMEQTQRDFVMHHKALQSLFTRMTTANTNANSDGIARAQRVLNKISAKARQSRLKRM